MRKHKLLSHCVAQENSFLTILRPARGSGNRLRSHSPAWRVRPPAAGRKRALRAGLRHGLQHGFPSPVPGLGHAVTIPRAGRRGRPKNSRRGRPLPRRVACAGWRKLALPGAAPDREGLKALHQSRPRLLLLGSAPSPRRGEGDGWLHTKQAFGRGFGLGEAGRAAGAARKRWNPAKNRWKGGENYEKCW